MKTIGDLHRDIEAQFPNRALGLSLNDGVVSVNQWADGIKESERDAINAFIASYDFNELSRRDIDMDIEIRLKEAAQDSVLSDADFIAFKQKLERAQHIDDIGMKRAKVAEAETVKAEILLAAGSEAIKQE